MRQSYNSYKPRNCLKEDIFIVPRKKNLIKVLKLNSVSFTLKISLQ